ncbi:MAG TPA: hypothetical protein VH814_02470, partial [Steroidobacteraceae bacterium]
MIELNPAVRELIAIYTKDLSQEPETRPDFKALDAANGTTDEFKRARSVLREYRPIIIECKDRHPQLQVIACLHAVKRESGPLSRAVIRDLALQALA